MKRSVAAVALIAASIPAAAHEIHHGVERGEATVLTFTCADGSAFSYESFEVFRPGETTPFQIGRSDALGRVSFLPDRAGEWRVRVFSEDGHGADLRVSASPAGDRAADRSPPPANRASRIVLGLGVILGVFGTWSLIRSRR